MFSMLWAPAFPCCTQWTRQPSFRWLVCDQGREFISIELEQFASQHNVHLFHIGIGAPWQNGLTERTGGIVKTLVAACVAAQSLMGTQEMQAALGEGITAYNMDVGDTGFSPMQAAVGRQPLPPGDALGGNRLGELDAMTDSSFERQVAVRQTARMAMLRLHFSRSLKRALKARSRNTTVLNTPAVGDLVYYWREQKYNRRGGQNKRRLLLRKWHGPSMLVALEGSNCYVTSRGTLAKVALEHVRRASAMEQLANGEWETVLQEIVHAASRDQEWELVEKEPLMESDEAPELEARANDDAGLPRQSSVPEPPRGPTTSDVGLDEAGAADDTGLPRQSSVPEPGGPHSDVPDIPSFRQRLREAMTRATQQRGGDLPPVTAGEFVQAASGSAPSESRRPSTLLGPVASGLSSHAPGTPTAAPPRHEGREPSGEMAASLSTKRPAELEAEALREGAGAVEEAGSFDALAMEKSTILAAAQAKEGEVHPLVQLQALAAQDRAAADGGAARDHGTWDGRWPLPSRSEYEAFVKGGLKWPTSRDAFVVQAARKEYHWSSMSPEQKAAFKTAAAEAWDVWVRNEAVEVLSEQESERVMATLRQRGELHKVLRPRFVYTDKNDGLRTEQNNLPLRASARLVVPGYKDVTAYEIRKDAPTASRTSQHMLFSLGASKYKDGWRTGTADVKSAFMKGERYGRLLHELGVVAVASTHRQTGFFSCGFRPFPWSRSPRTCFSVAVHFKAVFPRANICLNQATVKANDFWDP